MKILFVAGTNFELYFVSSVAALLQKSGFTLNFKLLLRDVFAKNLTQELRNLYSEVEFFKIPTLTPTFSKNPLLMIFYIFQNIYETLRFRHYIKKELASVDIVLISCFREFFANIMCRQAPKKTKLVALRMADQKLEQIDFARKPVVSFLLNVKNFFFGFSTMDYKWSREQKWYLVAKNFHRNPYHAIIAICDYDFGKKGDCLRLPPPFPALRELYKFDDDKPGILFAGDKTPVYDTWDKEDQKIYDNLLDFLREKFEDHKLYFKPKPGRTDPSKYNLEGFELLKAESSLEELCLRKNIKKVVTVRSTSAKVGAYFNIPSYLLYGLFKTPQEFKSVVENYFDDVRSVCRMKSFEDIYKEPAATDNQYTVEKLAKIYQEAIL